VLATFYPGIDGRLLYGAIALVAVAVIIATRGRLGYRSDTVTSGPALMTQVARA